MAPAHQYHPAAVTAATIKPAASTTPYWRAQVATAGGTLNSRCECIWAKHSEVSRGMEGGIGAAHVPRPHNRTPVTACPSMPRASVNSGKQQLERQFRHGLLTALEAFPS
jgi:hypothetical protein